MLPVIFWQTSRIRIWKADFGNKLDMGQFLTCRHHPPGVLLDNHCHFLLGILHRNEGAEGFDIP